MSRALFVAALLAARPAFAEGRFFAAIEDFAAGARPPKAAGPPFCSMKSEISGIPSPIRRLLNTNGRVPRIRRASRPNGEDGRGYQTRAHGFTDSTQSLEQDSPGAKVNEL